MKPTKMRILLLLLLAVWMIFIFTMSAMDSVSSQGLSARITQKAISVFMPQFQNYPADRQAAVLEKANHIVRKMGHTSEYAVMGILAGMMLLNRNKKMLPRAAAALLICAAYAVSDEVHQMFVAGRSPQITDVMIDTGGAAIGIFLVYLVFRTRKKQQLKTAIQN